MESTSFELSCFDNLVTRCIVHTKGIEVDFSKSLRGLPLITYATRGGGGVNTDAYKCVQGGRGGLNMTKNTHFVRRLIENDTKIRSPKGYTTQSKILKLEVCIAGI